MTDDPQIMVDAIVKAASTRTRRCPSKSRQRRPVSAITWRLACQGGEPGRDSPADGCGLGIGGGIRARM